MAKEAVEIEMRGQMLGETIELPVKIEFRRRRRCAGA